MQTPTYTTETKLLQTYQFIAGIDEVGRAPLAGPVVSAVVILKPEAVGRYRSKTKWWAGVRDSKTLSAIQREALADFIKQYAHDFGIGQASHQEIDELNIHQASLLSMRRAVESLQKAPDILLVDGRFTIPLPQFLPPGPERSVGAGGGGKVKGIEQHAIVDGDAQVLSIAAASILAKVYRDELMRKFANTFPVYGFERHKGYDTDFHRKNLRRHGPCEIHRMSFSTVRDIMNRRFGSLINNS